jgi:DNA-binding PadR family transcriptional regulator
MKQMSRTQREVLELLASEGRTHAYEVKLRLKNVLGHSSVYAALAAAEAKGYVRAEWEDPTGKPPGSGLLRKYYDLTDLGRDALGEIPLKEAPYTRRVLRKGTAKA